MRSCRPECPAPLNSQRIVRRADGRVNDVLHDFHSLWGWHVNVPLQCLRLKTLLDKSGSAVLSVAVGETLRGERVHLLYGPL